MVDLYVRPEKVYFRVHKNMVCKVEYFHKMLHGGFTEASSSSANFPDDCSVAFDVLSWIYHGTLRRLEIVDVVGNTYRTNWVIPETYALAEKLCLPELQDLIMSTAMEWWRSSNLVPTNDLVDIAYQKTSQNSPLRKYMVRVFGWRLLKCRAEYCSTASLHSLLKENDDLSIDFLTLLRQGHDFQFPGLYSNCEFHCHANNKVCMEMSWSSDR